jgi:hypothetical protein
MRVGVEEAVDHDHLNSAANEAPRKFLPIEPGRVHLSRLGRFHALDELEGEYTVRRERGLDA